jgi:uncharacterized membrane protein
MKNIKKAIKKYMLAGLLITVPIALTYMILRFVVTNVDGWMEPVTTRILGTAGIAFMEEYHIPGLGFLILMLFIAGVGVLGTNFLGRRLVRLGEQIVTKIPFVRVIYTSIKKVVDTISQTETPTFQKMVLLTYPRPPLKTLGIVCCNTRGEILSSTGGDTINVFVPTSPNPTTGFLLMVPRKDLQFMDMTVEEGLKTIISFGMVASNDNGNSTESQKEDPAQEKS